MIKSTVYPIVEKLLKKYGGMIVSESWLRR
jgi:hypothetical protein